MCFFAGVFARPAGEEDCDPEPRLLRPHRLHPLADQAALPARVHVPRHTAPPGKKVVNFSHMSFIVSCNFGWFGLRGFLGTRVTKKSTKRKGVAMKTFRELAY